MKKSLLILSALMALSMAFVGCEGGSDPVQDPAGDDTPAEVVVFDAATATAPEGMEIVEIDGVKYLKVTPDGYNTYFNVTEVSVAANKKLYVTMKGETDDAGYQGIVQCLEDFGKSVCGNNANPTMKPISADAKEYVADLVGAGKKIKIVQPMVQSTTDWSEQTKVTIFISKIIAK